MIRTPTALRKAIADAETAAAILRTESIIGKIQVLSRRERVSYRGTVGVAATDARYISDAPRSFRATRRARRGGLHTERRGVLVRCGMANCLHLNHRPALAGASNSVGVWCEDCGDWATKALGYAPGPWLPKDHRLIAGANRAELPRKNVVLVSCEICEQQTSTPELHHWCPRALYRDHVPALPNEGPQAWLCQSCHKTWHAVVTPGLLADDALAFVRALYVRMRKRPGAWSEFVRVVNDSNARVERAMPPRRQDAAA